MPHPTARQCPLCRGRGEVRRVIVRDARCGRDLSEVFMGTRSVLWLPEGLAGDVYFYDAGIIICRTCGGCGVVEVPWGGEEDGEG